MLDSSVKDTKDKLTPFGLATLQDRYFLPGEDFAGLVNRVAGAYSDNEGHKNRMIKYISNMWFMPATPILSNGGTNRGLPISCFVNEVDDSLKSIVDLWVENVWLASKGGGIGTYWGSVRSIGEKLFGAGCTSGVIPFLKVVDSMTLAISQGSLRRGSAAVYLPVDHPEILEFVDIRKPTGGDYNRKTLNIHHAVCITDAFMQAVSKDMDWDLKSPKTGEVILTTPARGLWMKILSARLEIGEPYLLFIDNVNNGIPECHQKLGLKVKTSNLCSEITLPTGIDHLGNNRTAVCCLASLNLEYFDDWSKDKLIIEDCLRFLDNVLQDFINKAPDSMSKAVYAANRERSVGLGVMGFGSYLQKKMTPFESATATAINIKMFKHIKNGADIASRKLAEEKGPCLDAKECGLMERFANKTSIAPTASISIIAGGASPCVEPYTANIYTHKTLGGSFTVVNKYLKEFLKSKNKLTDETMSSIMANQGSVAHLDFLSDHEKDVFKTAYEIDQMWIIDHAANRSNLIDQAQSVNLFFKGDVHKRDLHRVHFKAWQRGVKSLYYCRSTAISRADNVSQQGDKYSFSTDGVKSSVNRDYDECLSCQ
ncbi:MAG: ribonucleoside-diphosphate reductase subunit alpha [Alphaproteobacteria bacterium]|nr:ribonucleoside-diphosphate reductase subunit alpha [Rickettsiales bacterium]